uniref:Uncharacterized protein n=1 Tax=Trichobilharzia regenti TaxID=157069 RepID=A0AA85JKC7_TRIRE|nr:unnamed protein product [Trichobilharzia regenti]
MWIPIASVSPNHTGLPGAVGLQNVINDAIQNSSYDIQSTLYSSTVLSGGCTLLPGFARRLESELKLLNSSKNQCILIYKKQNDQKYAVCISGSILASLSSFRKIYIEKKEYEEVGASVVHAR